LALTLTWKDYSHGAHSFRDLGRFCCIVTGEGIAVAVAARLMHSQCFLKFLVDTYNITKTVFQLCEKLKQKEYNIIVLPIYC
jgi:hypothetical protein